jgi:hypothetical protein
MKIKIFRGFKNAAYIVFNVFKKTYSNFDLCNLDTTFGTMRTDNPLVCLTLNRKMLALLFA